MNLLLSFNVIAKSIQKSPKFGTEVKKDGIQTKDFFGNKIIYINMNDGCHRKITQTNDGSKFIFLDNVYSINILKAANVEKVYYDDYHSKRKLVRDIYGRLFHYRYDEEMCLDRDFRIEIIWILVQDEQASDNLVNNQSKLALIQRSYVYSDQTSHWVAANEYI